MIVNSQKDNKILFIEICNFTDYPIGGYLAFAKQMLTSFGNQLLLVGMTTDDTPVGVWTKKNFEGVEYDFLSVRRVEKRSSKPLIPGRLKSYLAVRKYRKIIFSKPIDNVFIQTPEVLFAIKNQKIHNLCVRIPGVENSLSISRYWYGKYFATMFDKFFFKSLKKANAIFASADKNAIDDFLKRGNGLISTSNVIQFPTRVNTDVFCIKSIKECRLKLKIADNKIVIVTTGRLNAYKGWKFMIDVFKKFQKSHPDSKFIFLGDGEDRSKIENYVEILNLTQSIDLPGRLSHEDLPLYINAANVYIMGSYVEGWSTSLVEAIACAKPVVCTNFSSASELIENGYNGFVIPSHDVDLFVDAVVKCLGIPEERLIIQAKKMNLYSTNNLKNSILENWRLI